MKNNASRIAIGCCAVFFCTGSVYAQDTPSCATAKFTFTGVECGAGFNTGGTINYSIKGKGSPILSLETNSVMDSSDCAKIVWDADALAGGSDYQKEYDSARYVIEHCASFSRFPPLYIWSFFGEASGGVQYLSTDPNRWPIYREWLKKVLYLNMDTNYYCSDVRAILACFSYFNAERGNDANGALAVIKFLQDSHLCFNYLPHPSWSPIRRDQYQYWRDTVKDSIKTPFAADTTLPSLEDLDLQILRGPQYAAVKDAFTPSTLTKIKYFNVSENPFKDETTLRFGLVDAEYMKIEIFDLLGNKVYSDSKLFGAGDEEWQLDGKTLASGSLYARLSTMGGEVKTVKLVHEK